MPIPKRNTKKLEAIRKALHYNSQKRGGRGYTMHGLMKRFKVSQRTAYRYFKYIEEAYGEEVQSIKSGRYVKYYILDLAIFDKYSKASLILKGIIDD